MLPVETLLIKPDLETYELVVETLIAVLVGRFCVARFGVLLRQLVQAQLCFDFVDLVLHALTLQFEFRLRDRVLHSILGSLPHVVARNSIDLRL